jgi:HlyD family secretion protein
MPSSSHRRRALRALIVLAVLGAGAAGYLVLGGHAATPPIPGLVRVTEIKIAPEISGRMKEFHVAAGAAVRRGELLAELDNPEIAAAVVEGRAVVDLARAARDRVYAGLRREQVDILAREVDKAQADLGYAQQQLHRTTALASRDNASRQDLDRATAAVAARQAELAAAQARHDAGVAGPTLEERNAADAKVAQAEAALTSLERRLDKIRLAAPVDGVVQVLVAEPGEAIVPGQPVMTIDTALDRWITFNVREDRLAGIDIGTQLDLIGDGGTKIAARVTEIRALGEFATWRAARAAGDHDLNTFLVRVDPSASGGLEPGMTVWLPR